MCRRGSRKPSNGPGRSCAEATGRRSCVVLRPVNCSGLPRERKATPRRACNASTAASGPLGGREVYRVSRCGRVPGPVQELVARGRTAIHGFPLSSTRIEVPSRLRLAGCFGGSSCATSATPRGNTAARAVETPERALTPPSPSQRLQERSRRCSPSCRSRGPSPCPPQTGRPSSPPPPRVSPSPSRCWSAE